VRIHDDRASALRPILGDACFELTFGDVLQIFVDGQLDEIRIETVARSAAWMQAEIASQTDTWIHYGAIER